LSASAYKDMSTSIPFARFSKVGRAACMWGGGEAGTFAVRGGNGGQARAERLCPRVGNPRECDKPIV